MNDSQATVYVVDDEAAVLKALSRLLRADGYHVIPFSSAQRFLDQYEGARPACLVLDLAMPGLNGMGLQQALAASGQQLPIVFLSGRADVPTSVQAMKLGATDFLTKPVERSALLQAVRSALSRDKATRLAQQEVDEVRRRLATLTPREHEVFTHVISGKLNKQTAADIGAAEKTVKIHRARVMEKMRVDSLAQLVRLAERAGIEPPSIEA